MASYLVGRSKCLVLGPFLQFRGESGHHDELFIMMQKARVEELFVHDIKVTLDPAIVACADQKLDDLVCFGAP